jgi:hypothetical protein
VLVSPAGLQGYDKIRVKCSKEGCIPSWRNRMEKEKQKERNLIKEYKEKKEQKGVYFLLCTPLLFSVGGSASKCLAMIGPSPAVDAGVCLLSIWLELVY